MEESTRLVPVFRVRCLDYVSGSLQSLSQRIGGRDNRGSCQIGGIPNTTVLVKNGSLQFT